MEISRINDRNCVVSCEVSYSSNFAVFVNDVKNILIFCVDFCKRICIAVSSELDDTILFLNFFNYSFSSKVDNLDSIDLVVAVVADECDCTTISEEVSKVCCVIIFKSSTNSSAAICIHSTVVTRYCDSVCKSNFCCLLSTYLLVEDRTICCEVSAGSDELVSADCKFCVSAFLFSDSNNLIYACFSIFADVSNNLLTSEHINFGNE